MAGFGCSCAKKFKAAGTFFNLAIMGFRDITMKGYGDGQPSSFSSGLGCTIPEYGWTSSGQRDSQPCNLCRTHRYKYSTFSFFYPQSAELFIIWFQNDRQAWPAVPGLFLKPSDKYNITLNKKG